jgi:hypothetical protein
VHVTPLNKHENFFFKCVLCETKKTPHRIGTYLCVVLLRESRVTSVAVLGLLGSLIVGLLGF